MDNLPSAGVKPQNMARLLSYKIRRLSLILILLISAVGCDQATKALARGSLGVQRLSYLGDLFRLQHAENPGAFLSIGAGLQGEYRFWIFVLGVSIFLIAALWALVKKPYMDQASTIAITLIVAGGIGNLIDRAIKGTVTDFMNLGIGWLRTGIFNVADVAIMMGAAILLINALTSPRSQVQRQTS
jgi:signal peptidase II